jgi:hypothetical protein
MQHHHRNSNSGQFRVRRPNFRNILAETNRFVLRSVLLSRSVSDPQKTSPRIKPRSVCRGCDICFCNLPAQKSNFVFGAFLLSVLVSDPQQPTSPGVELRTIFRNFCPTMSVCSRRFSMPSMVQIGLSILQQ